MDAATLNYLRICFDTRVGDVRKVLQWVVYDIPREWPEDRKELEHLIEALKEFNIKISNKFYSGMERLNNEKSKQG